MPRAPLPTLALSLLLLGCGGSSVSAPTNGVLLGVWGAGQVQVEATEIDVDITAGCIRGHIDGAIRLGVDGDFRGTARVFGPELMQLTVQYEGQIFENDDLRLTLTVEGVRLPTYTLKKGWRADLANLVCPL